MKKLLDFLITQITKSQDFEIEEQSHEDRVELLVKADPKIIGLIIGKQGRTIKNLRKILSIKAVSEKKAVHISVQEKAKA